MRFLFSSTVLLAASLCHAQEVRPVECRFLSFGSPGQIPSALALTDKGEEIECPLSNTKLSKKITCQAKGHKIPFISAGDRKPMATATIPAGVNSALVVFVRFTAKDAAKPADSEGWKTYVIDDSAKSFPDGGAYVANFFSGDIRFVIGEHKGMLKAAMAHGYEMPKERDAFNMAPVVVEFRDGEKWRTANESSLRFLPGMRYLIFAYLDPLSGRPKINTYQDFAPPKTAAAAP
jgi:hypothetical protein